MEKRTIWGENVVEERMASLVVIERDGKRRYYCAEHKYHAGKRCEKCKAREKRWRQKMVREWERINGRPLYTTS